MIEIILFDLDDKVIDKMQRNIVPNIGDSIQIDCGYAVEVIAVSHQWDTDNIVQIKVAQIINDECELNYPPLCIYYEDKVEPCAYGIANDVSCPYTKE